MFIFSKKNLILIFLNILNLNSLIEIKMLNLVYINEKINVNVKDIS